MFIFSPINQQYLMNVYMSDFTPFHVKDAQPVSPLDADSLAGLISIIFFAKIFTLILFSCCRVYSNQIVVVRIPDVRMTEDSPSYSNLNEETLDNLPQNGKFIFVEERWYIVIMPSVDDESRGRGNPQNIDEEQHGSLVRGKYYIGLVLEAFNADNDLIMSTDLLLDSSTMFFQFPMERAKKLMTIYAEDDEEPTLFAEDMCVLLGLRDHSLENVYYYPICNKTYWIRIIQRKWRSVYRRRMELLRRRGGIVAQRRFELTGNYGLESGAGCSLKGMLRPLFQSKKI